MPEKVSEVCEIDGSGLVIRVCGKQIHDASYVSLESDGRLLLVDYMRVVLLNSRLELERVLLDTEDLFGCLAIRVCYVQQTGRVFVGCSSKVQAFVLSGTEHK